MRKLLISIFGVLLFSIPAHSAGFVQASACTTGGCMNMACSTTTPTSGNCALTGVISTHTLHVFGRSNTNTPFTISGCGGTWTSYDGAVADTNNYVMQATGTGISGSCTVNCNSTAAYAISCGIIEINTGYVPDSGKHNIQVLGSMATSITTTSVTTTAADYCVSGSVDDLSGDTSAPTLSAGTVQASDIIFPLAVGDQTQGGAGAITFTWNAFQAGAMPVASVFCFTPPTSTVVRRRR